MAESRTSNASSLNQDHNRTAQFNVIPENSNINGTMNGSKHSFYGTQQTAGSKPVENTANNNKSRSSGRGTILLSKGSKQGSQQHSTNSGK